MDYRKDKSYNSGTFSFVVLANDKQAFSKRQTGV